MKVKMMNERLTLCKELWRFKDRANLEAVKYPTQNSNPKCKTMCDHQKAAGSAPGAEQGRTDHVRERWKVWGRGTQARPWDGQRIRPLYFL